MQSSYNLVVCKVFLELTHKKQLFRLEFSLADDLAPMAAANFRALCTGEKGGDLTYVGSKVHCISKGGSGASWYIEGGDITKGQQRTHETVQERCSWSA